MKKRCIDREEKSLRSTRRRWRSAFCVVAMMLRVVRPSVAFRGLQRSLIPSIHHAVPASQVLTSYVSQKELLLASSRSRRLVSLNSRDDNGPTRRNTTEPTRHFILDSIETSIQNDIISNLPDSTKDVVLLVGVSGGCDSVGLLYALVRLLARVNDGSFQLTNSASDVSFRIHVVHFNHKQRGEASDGDALFVQELCGEFNLVCHGYEWDDDSSSKTTFSQDKARTWRRSTMYSLLQSLTCNEREQGVILTAHHLNDSQESLLLKVIRGVHLTNLAGMDSVVLDSEDAPNAIIARPMLNICKDDIMDFLESGNHKWREDESNASDKYLRNRVRNELIPLLSDLVGGDDALQKRLDNVSSQSKELKDDLSKRARVYLEDMKSDNEDKTFHMSGESLGLVEKEALHQWAQACMGFPLPYDQLQRIAIQIESQPDQQTWTLQVGRGWNIVRNGAVLVARNEGMDDIDASPAEREIEWSFLDSSDVQAKGSLTVRLPDSITADDCVFVLSSVELTGTWACFTPPWRENPTKLKDFLRGQKVPLHRRGSAPVVLLKCDDQAHLVAVFIENHTGDAVFAEKGGKWIVDRQFSVGTKLATTGMQRIRIEL